MLGLPLQCSVILTRQKGHLYRCNSMKADYLFHPTADVQYDVGDQTLQCGRRVDTLKLFLSWKAHGDQGFRFRIERALENAQYFADLIKALPESFELVQEPTSVSVGFWCIPPSIRSLERGPERDRRITELAHVIRQRMYHQGRVMV